MGSRLLVRYLEEHDWYCAEIKVDYQVYKHVTYSDKKISVPMDEEELGEAYLTDVARALEIPLADLLAFEKKPRGVQPPLSL